MTEKPPKTPQALSCANAAMLAALLLAFPALADPCKAIPDGMAGKTELRVPQEVVGPVVYVGDGDGLCVAGVTGREADPGTWVEIRLQDFYAPELSQPGGREAKAVLTRITKGMRVGCMGGHYSYDRLVARCTDLNGNSLGDLMRRAGVKEGGSGRGPQCGTQVPSTLVLVSVKGPEAPVADTGIWSVSGRATSRAQIDSEAALADDHLPSPVAE